MFTLMTNYIDNTVPSDKQQELCRRIEKGFAHGRGEWVRPYYDADKTFGLWMVLVNRELVRRADIGVPHLSDQPYRTWFDEGQSPSDAVSEVMKTDDLLSLFQ